MDQANSIGIKWGAIWWCSQQELVTKPRMVC
jgi:hypothetical protein